MNPTPQLSIYCRLFLVLFCWHCYSILTAGVGGGITLSTPQMVEMGLRDGKQQPKINVSKLGNAPTLGSGETLRLGMERMF